MRGRAPLAVAMTASARPNKVLTPRTTVARSKSGVSGRNIMYFIRGVSDHTLVPHGPAPALKAESRIQKHAALTVFWFTTLHSMVEVALKRCAA